MDAREREVIILSDSTRKSGTIMVKIEMAGL